MRELEIPMEVIQEPICECKRCIVERKIAEVEQQECTCTYKVEHKKEFYIDENGIEQTREYDVTVIDVQCARCIDLENCHTILDHYDTLEKANIDEEYWEMCNIKDGIIYTPTQEEMISRFDNMDEQIINSQKIIIELQKEMK